MLIRNFRNSGPAAGAVAYVLSRFDSNRTLRSVPPKILRGDPAITKMIDREFCQHFTHRSLSGVLSFRPGEHISENQKQELIDDFERTMFGNMRDRVNVLWVEHMDKNRRLELHYVLNRVDMEGKGNLFYNPFPPGRLTKELVKTFSALKNEEYGFQPIVEKPNKTKYTDGEIKGRKNPRNGFRDLKGKMNIDRALTELVKDGTLKNRNELIEFLSENGMKLSRAGKDYISIERDGRNIRLRGGIYADTGKDYQPTPIEPPPMPTYEQNLHRLNEIVSIRNTYNTARYGAKVMTRPALQSKKPNHTAHIAHADPHNEPHALKTSTPPPLHQGDAPPAASAPIHTSDDVIVSDNTASDFAFDAVKSATQSVSTAEISLASAISKLAKAKTPEQRANAEKAVNEARARLERAQAQLANTKVRDANTTPRLTRTMR